MTKYELCFWNNNDKFIEYEVSYIQTSDVIRSRHFEMKDGQPYLIVNNKTIFIDGLSLCVPKTSQVFNKSNMTGRTVTIGVYKEEWKTYLSKLGNIAPPMSLSNTTNKAEIDNVSTNQQLKEVVNDKFDNRKQLDSKTINDMVQKSINNPIEKMESMGWKQVVFDTGEDGNIKTSLKEQKKPRQNLTERKYGNVL